ncbi:hypothetical protein KAH94_05905 [bacterium]|nr:hypothetical protein [bacterium]
MKRLLSQRWLRFKQELPSIVFFSTIAIWDGFNFPNYMNLGVFWHTVFLVMRSSFGGILIVYLFTSIDKLAPYIKFEPIKDTFDTLAAANKIVSVLLFIIGFSIAMFYMWRINFFGMSNFYYVFSCIYIILLWALLYRAACRVDSTD